MDEVKFSKYDVSVCQVHSCDASIVYKQLKYFHGERKQRQMESLAVKAEGSSRDHSVSTSRSASKDRDPSCANVASSTNTFNHFHPPQPKLQNNVTNINLNNHATANNSTSISSFSSLITAHALAQTSVSDDDDNNAKELKASYENK
jgi:hypothetical protein